MPQEIEVFYIIPSIRKSLAQHFKLQGKSQKDIARLLYLQESTVSHYIHNKRGDKITFLPVVERAIADAASRIHDHFDLIRETQSLLKFIRETRNLCSIHQQLSHLPSSCNALTMGCVAHVSAQESP